MGLFSKKIKNTTFASSSDIKSYLKISMTKDGSEYTLSLNGRLDTVTSPDLQSKINEVVDDANKLILDFAELEYISSAGLRVLLSTVQAMEDKGEVVVRDLTPSVREVFDLTGFCNMLNIE